MLVWAIYFAQNHLLWKGRKSRVEFVINLARITLDQWRKAQERSLFPAFDTWYLSNGAELWSKSCYEKLKVNIDVALLDEEKRHGFSGIVQDHKGRVVAGITGLRIGKILPKIAEAMALKEVLSWLKCVFSGVIIVKSNCLVLVQAIRNSNMLSSTFGGVVKDCKQLLSSFKDVSLVL
uniref:RNase H type-1 domain-containing protein n=1 Tax=Cannabis sativa TaxID=3483 RepID=A0A803NGW7_CANSA